MISITNSIASGSRSRMERSLGSTGAEWRDRSEVLADPAPWVFCRPGSFVDAPFPANSEHCLQQCRVSVTPGSTDSAAPPPRVRQAGCEVDWWILGWKSCQNRLRNWPEVHHWSEGRVGGSTPNRLEILLKATQKSSQKLSCAGSRGVPAGTRGGPGGVLGHLERPGRVLGAQDFSET